MDSITKICKKCGVEKTKSDFRIWSWICKACQARAQAQRRKENPEYEKEYYIKNKTLIREKQTAYENNGGREKRHEYSMSHREEQKARNEKWKSLHREEKLAYDRKYNEAHKDEAQEYRNRTKEQKKQYNKRYIQEHPEKISAKTQKRRARERSADGFFTEEEWKAVCVKYNYTCLRCGKTGKMTPDHVVPLSKGGTSFIDNIQPLCRSCNSSKGDKIEDYRKDAK